MQKMSVLAVMLIVSGGILFAPQEALTQGVPYEQTCRYGSVLLFGPLFFRGQQPFGEHSALPYPELGVYQGWGQPAPRTGLRLMRPNVPPWSYGASVQRSIFSPRRITYPIF